MGVSRSKKKHSRLIIFERFPSMSSASQKKWIDILQFYTWLENGRNDWEWKVWKKDCVDDVRNCWVTKTYCICTTDIMGNERLGKKCLVNKIIRRKTGLLNKRQYSVCSIRSEQATIIRLQLDGRSWTSLLRIIIIIINSGAGSMSFFPLLLFRQRRFGCILDRV